jgi:cell division protein FtsB
MSTVAPPRAAKPAGDARRRPRARLTPAGAVLAFAIVVLLTALAVPVRTLMQQRADLARLQRDELTLQQRNDVLQQQVARLHDPVYLERIARECLGMVRPGEIPFVMVGGADSASSGSNGPESPRDATNC